MFFIDVNATVADDGDCKLRVSLETFLMEFRLGYDFTHGGTAPGADAELPEVKPTMPDGSAGGDTHNIAKKVAANGTATDRPFPPPP